MKPQTIPRETVVDNDKNVVVDNVIVDYDASKWDFGSWVRQRLNDEGYDVTDLTRIHEVVPYDKIQALGRQLTRETGDADFIKIAHGFTHEVLEPIFGDEIAVQRYMNIRIMLPKRSEMTIAYHTGLWYGHGMGQATCWVPLTPVSGTNSLYVISLADSRRLMKEAIENGWDQDQMQAEFVKFAWPIEAAPGQANLFNQEIIHGNATNTTEQTRVSIDFRLALKGGKLRRKRVGGYFTLLDPTVRGGERRATSAPATPKTGGDYTCIGYVNNSTLVTSGIPIVVQRLMMRDYLKERGMPYYTYEQLENEVFPYLPTLKSILTRDKPNEVVLYSIYSLPDAAEHRKVLYDAALDNGVTMHFANEDVQLRTPADRDYIEEMITFARLEPVARLP